MVAMGFLEKKLELALGIRGSIGTVLRMSRD